MVELQEMMKGLVILGQCEPVKLSKWWIDTIKRWTCLKCSPWQWEHGRWRSLSAVTRAAGWPGVTLAPSSGCKCRTGWWWRRAARSRRRKGRRCKTETTARGWAPANQCSRRCRTVLDRNGPTAPKAPQQTLMRNTTLPPPGGGRAMKRTCFLIRQEMEFHTFIVTFTPLLQP